MRREGVNYLVVGSFVLLMLVGMVVALYLVTGRTGPADTYYVNYPNVAGIRFGTPVYYEGYQIGQVQEVVPQRSADGTQFRLALAVEKGWQIPDDSIAQARASGLLSSVTINLREGDSRGFLVPGAEIRGQAAQNFMSAINRAAEQISELSHNAIQPLIKRLSHSVDTVAGTLEDHGPRLLSNLDALVLSLNQEAPTMIREMTELSRDLKGRAPQAMDEFASLARDLRGQLPGLMKDASLVMQQLHETSRRLGRLLGRKNLAHVETLLVNLDSASASAEDLMEHLDGTRKRIDRMLIHLDGAVSENREGLKGTVEAMQHTMRSIDRRIASITHNLDGTARNMNEFSRQIRQNPGLLLGSKPPSDRVEVPR